jgi:hypothetical protein
MFVSCTVFVLSGRGLCEGPIARPEESYRLWCVFECDQVKIKTLYNYCERTGRRGKDYETKRSLEAREGVMGVVTRQWPGRSGVMVPAEARNFSFLRNVRIGSDTHQLSYSVGTVGGVFFPGVKRPGCEFGDLPQANSRLRMSGTVPLLPLYTLNFYLNIL